MKSLNTILFTDANLSNKIVINQEPIQAFSSYQNTVRVIAPYNEEWIPFAIFQPNNADNNVGIPSQFLIMTFVEEVVHDGETFYAYEIDVPEAITGTVRGNQIELVVSFWAIQSNLVGVAKYDETVSGYNETTYIKGKLEEDFPNALEDEFVRVFNTETDWRLTETSEGSEEYEWVNTDEQLISNLQDNRSELITFALRKGKSTNKPTHVPNNTEQILSILNGKVNSATLTQNYYDKNQSDGLLADKLNRSGTPAMEGDLDLGDYEIINVSDIDTTDIKLPGYESVKSELDDLNNTKLDRDGSPGLIGNLQVNQQDIVNAGNIDAQNISANDLTINDLDANDIDASQITADDVTVDTHGSVVGKLTQLQAEKVDKALSTYATANLGTGEANVKRFFIDDNGTAKRVTLQELRTYIAEDFASFGFVIANNDGNDKPDVPELERFSNKIYLVAIDDPANQNDNYAEFLYIDDDWEFIGTTNVDLTDYYTKTEVDNLLQADDIDYDDTNTDYDTSNVQTTLEKARALIGNAGVSDYTYYVDVSGDDTNEGSANNPFKTIKHATEVVAALPPEGYGAFGPIRPVVSIKINSGKYYEQLPIVVPAQTSLVGTDLRTVQIYPAEGLSDDGVTPNDESTMFQMSSGTLAINLALYGMGGYVKPADIQEPETAVAKGVGFALNPASPIFGASPYILDCSAFFPNGISAYVDGEVHAITHINQDLPSSPPFVYNEQQQRWESSVLPIGAAVGNRSMLFYAYTNINDEGVGFWTDNGGVIESVSNFTYYTAYGYLATRGGYIRGLNGSNSWGTWALFAKGYLPTETPIEGQLIGKIIDYADLIGAFQVGQTVTGTTSGATAVILNVQEGNQSIYVDRNSVETFIDDEEITTATATATITVNEYGQKGPLLLVTGLSEQPEIRTSVSIDDDDFTYVVASVSGSYVDSNSILVFTLAQNKSESSDPGENVQFRKRYSQIRVTGHDFLNVGSGGIASVTIGGGTLINPGTAPVQSQQVGEFDTGRVFAVSTDQDGNFRVGKYFSIDQGTGRATLDASAFDLSGLTSLRLGSIGAQLGESINEFSSDPTLSQNSNEKVPTQFAIKTYVDTLINLQATLDADVSFNSVELQKLIWDTVNDVEELLVGETHWNNDLGTLETQLDGVALEHGLQLYQKIENASGSALLKGRAVYVTGGQEPSEKVFAEHVDNTNELQAESTFGLVVDDINVDEEGYIITSGLLKDIDTSAWDVGDLLYATGEGILTNVAPSAPEFIIRVGVVIRKNASAGLIFVQPRLVNKITQLSDVDGTYEEGDVLRNDGTEFIPFDLDTALGGKADLVDIGGGVLKVPASQLPSYVDDVVNGYYDEPNEDFYENYDSGNETFSDLLPEEEGKIYIDLSNNKTYRWGGSSYVQIGSDLALGETSTTAYRGDRGKDAYDHSQLADGSNPHATTFANIASKPNTISGYGITDSYTVNEIDVLLDGVELTIETTLNTNWTGSDPYEKVKTVSGILATDNPIIDLNLDSVAFADWEQYEQNWAVVKRAVTSADTITFYATDIPAVALPIRIKIVR